MSSLPLPTFHNPLLKQETFLEDQQGERREDICWIMVFLLVLSRKQQFSLFLVEVALYLLKVL
jgi:hypothetical protein